MEERGGGGGVRGGWRRLGGSFVAMMQEEVGGSNGGLAEDNLAEEAVAVGRELPWRAARSRWHQYKLGLCHHQVSLRDEVHQGKCPHRAQQPVGRALRLHHPHCGCHLGQRRRRLLDADLVVAIGGGGSDEALD